MSAITGYGERLEDNQSFPNRGALHMGDAVRGVATGASPDWIADGRPVDAGTAHILQSDAVHLAFESCRHLFTALGDGLCASNASNAWDSVNDASKPDTTNNPAAAIPWSQKNCMRFGPFFVPQDRPDPNNPGGMLLRAIEVEVAALVGVHFMFALTTSAAPPYHGAVAFVDTLYTGAGVIGTATYQLLATAPLPTPGPTMACRSSAAVGSPSTRAAQVYVWVGYYDQAGGGRVVCASGYEVRE